MEDHIVVLHRLLQRLPLSQVRPAATAPPRPGEFVLCFQRGRAGTLSSSLLLLFLFLLAAVDEHGRPTFFLVGSVSTFFYETMFGGGAFIETQAGTLPKTWFWSNDFLAKGFLASPFWLEWKTREPSSLRLGSLFNKGLSVVLTVCKYVVVISFVFRNGSTPLPVPPHPLNSSLVLLTSQPNRLFSFWTHTEWRAGQTLYPASVCKPLSASCPAHSYMPEQTASSNTRFPHCLS